MCLPVNVRNPVDVVSGVPSVALCRMAPMTRDATL